MELLPILLFLAFVYAASSIKIIKEFERGVIYTLGKYTSTIEPGVRFIFAPFQTISRIDMRVRVEDVPPQDVISKDNVSVRVSAVVYYRVIDPSYAINRVQNFYQATSELAQTTLRSVLGGHELDEILEKREKLNANLQEILDHQTESWGVKVTGVQIKQIDLDPSMIRAIAKQAEAERERRAKIINAEGEMQAAQKLDEASFILAKRPETMQLRYLGTLQEFASQGKSTTVVLPMPLDMLKAGLDKITK